MKLAEALVIRGDLQEKINQIQMRLSNNATVQEGEVPPENPTELLSQFNELTKELEGLVSKINLTNASIKAFEVTMTELLAKRDILKLRLSTYKNFLHDASSLTRRTRASEIKIKSTMPVAEIQKLIDSTSAALRKLELKIQELNWTNDLI